VLTKQTAADLRHTLRTPINHISGYSDILLEDLEGTPGAAEAIELLNTIREDARRNLEAIQNVLSGESDGLPATALAELQRRMSQPIARMRRAAETLEKILPEPMLPDLARILGATRELAAEIEMPATPAGETQPAMDVSCKAPDTPGTGSILIVDDDEGNRDMLYRRLERDGYSSALAADGETALDLMRRERFDLVLLDLVMPGLNGLQVIEIIKADQTLCHTPVILISAVDDMETVARCIELGAEDYLFKPVNPVLLRARVRSTLERQRAEEAMRRKQELESIGALAAGVAHDFNNLLTGILGNAWMLKDTLPAEDGNRYFAEEIIKSSERAADLTRQLLAYAGKGRYKLEPLDLSLLVSESAATIRALLPANVELSCELVRVPALRGDPDQLRQVILNLVTNAGEAVGTAAGKVTIATGIEEIEDDRAPSDFRLSEVAAGRYVYVEVRDTGQGMDPAATAKIFDPFYTTKFFGRGLGLAAVAGIVRMHGGSMRVSTAPQRGSSFRVLIPLPVS
jgi:signal transduction histidine kinase